MGPRINQPDFPGDRPHSDPEGHTAAQDRPKSPPGTDKGFLGDPGDPKGAPKTPKKAPKGPPNEPQATPSAALGSPNAPKRHLKRHPKVPTLEKKNRCDRQRASSFTDATFKQHCFENDLGPEECAERLNKNVILGKSGGGGNPHPMINRRRPYRISGAPICLPKIRDVWEARPTKIQGVPKGPGPLAS